MKKTLIAILLAVGLCAAAQTNSTDTNAPVISGPILDAIQFLTTGSNWMVIPYGTYAEDSESFGAGLATGYKVNEFFVPTMRIDWLSDTPDEVWMPSASVQLQVPVKLFNKVTVTPFAISGVATPIAGRDDDNGEVVGIFGAGLAATITDHVFIVGDWEKWTSFKGYQYRFGVGIKF